MTCSRSPHACVTSSSPVCWSATTRRTNFMVVKPKPFCWHSPLRCQWTSPTSKLPTQQHGRWHPCGAAVGPAAWKACRPSLFSASFVKTVAKPTARLEIVSKASSDLGSGNNQISRRKSVEVVDCGGHSCPKRAKGRKNGCCDHC